MRLLTICYLPVFAFVLNRRVVLHAIDATPARWRGDAGSSPLDRARTAASSPRNDFVKNYRVHPTHWLISTQVVTSKLRDRFGPDPRRSSGQREAWLVSVVAKPDGSFEARAYHPGTSVELSLPVPRAAAPAGKNPDRWAADVLPSKLVLDMGSGRPELVLRSTSPTRRR